MNEELVSVILPTYNRRETIKRAIDSVLNQTYQHIELIIVDDNSTDGTLELVSEVYGEDERIMYILNDANMGFSGAVNIGVQAAKGNWVAFQNSDDVWYPDKLKKQMAISKKAEDNVGMIYCRIMRYWTEGNGKNSVWPSEDLTAESISGDIHKHVLMEPLCSATTMLIRKVCFEAVGGFSSDIHSLEDYEFSIRFSARYQALLCDEPLVDVHETSDNAEELNDEKIWTQCLIMSAYRDEYKKYDLRQAKMKKVWYSAWKYGNIEVLEDNICLFADDEVYLEAFAALEGDRITEDSVKARLHIGIMLNDEEIIFGNGTRPEKGMPGMDKSYHELLMLIRYMSKNDNRIAVTVYHLNDKNTLPYNVKTVLANNKYEVVRRCVEDRQDYMIFLFDSDTKWYREINEYRIPCICWQTDFLETFGNAYTEILAQNTNIIKKTVCADRSTYELYAGQNIQKKMCWIENIWGADNPDAVIKKWESLLMPVGYKSGCIRMILWDFTGIGYRWISRNMQINRVDIVEQISADEDEPERVIFECEWDYLLIFEKEFRDMLNEKTGVLKISEDRIIYALDFMNWCRHMDMVYYLLKPDCNVIQFAEIQRERDKKEFVTCTVDGITYLGTNEDGIIMPRMYITGKNWAEQDMWEFYRLAKKYYHVDDSKGYFCDIGANIGTTGIYFKKKIDNNVTILAFEPEFNNYKLLTINLMLNGLADISVAENCGMSECSGMQTIHTSKINPGKSSILVDYGEEAEKIRMVSLEEYIQEKDISAADIKYMWIDTEGFEPMVLSGAAAILEENSIPLFMEFNPFLWNAAGMYERLVDVLSKAYTKYIVIPESLKGREILHDIEEIWNYQNVPKGFQQDIFLIK